MFFPALAVGLSYGFTLFHVIFRAIMTLLDLGLIISIPGLMREGIAKQKLGSAMLFGIFYLVVLGYMFANVGFWFPGGLTRPDFYLFTRAFVGVAVGSIILFVSTFGIPLNKEV